ncbi:MAG TPA: hypothetical protein VMA73_00210 [Streptosporangiaceae bacterium]|nr:hypothetical protein [Streptosporangiaceae bacterium]
MIPGAGVRQTRMDVAPSSVDEAIEVFGDTETPWLAEEAGRSSVLYLVDRDSGRSIGETVWRDAAALAESRSAAGAGGGDGGLRHPRSPGVHAGGQLGADVAGVIPGS